MRGRKFVQLLTVVILFSNPGLFGQKLPDEYRFSEDGRRLMRGQPVKGLYSDKVIRRVYLQFNDSNWPAKLLENYKTKKDIPATLTIDGKSYPNVGVRYKGYSSFTEVKGYKKSFNITMDFMDRNQDIDGYETLNFNNAVFDPSFIREVFYENLTRKYGPSFKASFVHLYLNGEDWGLYPHIQNLDSKFIKEWFLSNEGSRWRAESPGLITKYKPGLTAMNYLGEQSSVYEQNYTLKKTDMANPWLDLVQTVRVLDQSKNIDSLNMVLDLDRTLWFLAKEIVFEDHNGYVQDGGMDYQLFFDKKTGRISPLTYDNNNITETVNGDWDLFRREKDTLFPLCSKLFTIPSLRQRYLAHARTLVDDLFQDSVYIPLIDRYYDLIDSLVQQDKKKLMTYEEFLTGKENLKLWMKSRKDFILNFTEAGRPRHRLSDMVYLSGDRAFESPMANQPVIVRITVTGQQPIDSISVYYSTGYDGRFERITMRDNGLQADHTANDSTYSAILPGQSAGVYIRYYFEAVADDNFGTITYDPPGAEHDVYIYRVNPGGIVSKDIVINEVMSSNSGAVADQDGEFDDWIELYNTSDNTIDVSKWILTDNPAIPDKYRLPAGTKMLPKSYLIIWADEDGKQSGLHANFKLSASGESLSLKDNNGNIIDTVELPPLEENQSYTRQKNGKGGFIISSPSFNKNNDEADKSTRE